MSVEVCSRYYLTRVKIAATSKQDRQKGMDVEQELRLEKEAIKHERRRLRNEQNQTESPNLIYPPLNSPLAGLGVRRAVDPSLTINMLESYC